MGNHLRACHMYAVRALKHRGASDCINVKCVVNSASFIVYIYCVRVFYGHIYDSMEFLHI